MVPVYIYNTKKSTMHKIYIIHTKLNDDVQNTYGTSP